MLYNVLDIILSQKDTLFGTNARGFSAKCLAIAILRYEVEGGSF